MDSPLVCNKSSAQVLPEFYFSSAKFLKLWLARDFQNILLVVVFLKQLLSSHLFHTGQYVWVLLSKLGHLDDLKYPAVCVTYTFSFMCLHSSSTHLSFQPSDTGSSSPSLDSLGFPSTLLSPSCATTEICRPV